MKHPSRQMVECDFITKSIGTYLILQNFADQALVICNKPLWELIVSQQDSAVPNDFHILFEIRACIRMGRWNLRGW